MLLLQETKDPVSCIAGVRRLTWETHRGGSGRMCSEEVIWIQTGADDIHKSVREGITIILRPLAIVAFDRAETQWGAGGGESFGSTCGWAQ